MNYPTYLRVCRSASALAIFLAGLGLIIASTWFYLVELSYITESLVGKQIVIQNHSGPGFSRFEKSPKPRRLRLFFFNITNSADYDFTKKRFPLSRLQFTQIGPYIYDVSWQKKRISFDNSSATVNFTQVQTYSFNSKLSGKLNEDDIVHLANIGLAFPAEIQDSLKFTDEQANSLIFSQSVANIGFDGIATMKNISLFCAKGESCGIPATVSTGKENLNSVGNYLLFDGKSSISIWKNSTGHSSSANHDSPSANKCNSLHGTDGTQFSSQVDSTSILSIFEPFLCRTLLYEHSGSPGRYISGLWTVPFTTSSRNYLHLPENECYCLERDYNQCEPDMVNLALCRQYGPFRNLNFSLNLYTSTPYYAFNQDLLKHITFTHFNSTNYESESIQEHLSTLSLEPVTGIVVESVKRIQLNVPVRKDSSSQTQLASKYDYLPLLWFEETSRLDDRQIALLQEGVFSQQSKWMAGIFSFMALGIVLVLGSFALAAYYYILEI